MASWPLKRAVLGSWPMPMKSPFTASSRVALSWVLLSRTPVTPLSSPSTSSTTAFHSKAILGLLRARSAMIFDARRASRRWMRITLVAYLVRKVASSTAVSPPPTTATSTPLKKKPSQVAQALTPLPWNFFSEGMPSHLAEAPVATITASAR